MRAMDDESLQKNTCHHFTETITLYLDKEMEKQRAEPVDMGVGISQMENHRAQEVVLSYAAVNPYHMKFRVHCWYSPSTSKLVARYCRTTTPGSLATNTEEPLLALA
jgi:hypothetical protein